MREMPSIVSQRKKQNICSSPSVSIVQEISDTSSSSGNKQVEFMRLVPGNSKVSTTADSTSACQPLVEPDMTSSTNAVRSNRHPIDELTNEPIDVDGRPSQQLQKEFSGSSNNSSEYGPFVSGFTEEPRPRSSSFNSNILRNPRRGVHPQVPIDHLRRFSESQSMAKTGSADNVTAPHSTHFEAHLRHSRTVPEIPPLALSNDSGYSGYQTPPNGRPHHPPYSQSTSPPWPPNRQALWPVHVSPPAQTIFQPGHDTPSVTPPQMRPLTIETGHYQPEQSPQLVIGHQPYGNMQPGYSMPAGINYHQQRSHDQYSSLQSQGSATPEEGVCSYQRERKLRLATALQTEETEIAKLKSEEQQLLLLLRNEQESTADIDNSTTEKEVESMTAENRHLAFILQRFMAMSPSVFPVITPARDVPQLSEPNQVEHVGIPPVAPTPAPRVNSPSRPPVAQPPLPPSGPVHILVPPCMVPGMSVTPVRVPPVVPPRPTVAAETAVDESQQWACSQCTYLNHPLIQACEVCETPRPRTGNTTPSPAGLVKTSSCQHQSGCFCHAHLG